MTRFGSFWLVFFFYVKITHTYSLSWEGCFFFCFYPAIGKRRNKKCCFYSLTPFWPKLKKQKTQYFPEKKYDTFDLRFKMWSLKKIWGHQITNTSKHADKVKNRIWSGCVVRLPVIRPNLFSSLLPLWEGLLTSSVADTVQKWKLRSCAVACDISMFFYMITSLGSVLFCYFFIKSRQKMRPTR